MNRFHVWLLIQIGHAGDQITIGISRWPSLQIAVFTKKGAAWPPLDDTASLFLFLQVAQREKNLPVCHGIPEDAHDFKEILEKKICAPFVVRPHGARDKRGEHLFQGLFQKKPADSSFSVFLCDE
jgi:hypothetical protein